MNSVGLGRHVSRVLGADDNERVDDRDLDDCIAVKCPDCPPRHQCSTCNSTGEIHCAAHVSGDGCEDMVITCPDCFQNCGQLCEIIACMIDSEQAHQAWHQAHFCPRCGHPKDKYGSKLCSEGYCTVWFCLKCKKEAGATGPVGCPCERLRDNRILRMHTLYRSKKR